MRLTLVHNSSEYKEGQSSISKHWVLPETGQKGCHFGIQGFRGTIVSIFGVKRKCPEKVPMSQILGTADHNEDRRGGPLRGPAGRGTTCGQGEPSPRVQQLIRSIKERRKKIRSQINQINDQLKDLDENNASDRQPWVVTMGPTESVEDWAARVREAASKEAMPRDPSLAAQLKEDLRQLRKQMRELQVEADRASQKDCRYVPPAGQRPLLNGGQTPDNFQPPAKQLSPRQIERLGKLSRDMRDAREALDKDPSVENIKAILGLVAEMQEEGGNDKDALIAAGKAVSNNVRGAAKRFRNNPNPTDDDVKALLGQTAEAQTLGVDDFATLDALLSVETAVGNARVNAEKNLRESPNDENLAEFIRRLAISQQLGESGSATLSPKFGELIEEILRKRRDRRAVLKNLSNRTGAEEKEIEGTPAPGPASTIDDWPSSK